MTRTQKIQVRQSELRKSVAELLDVESEKRAEDHEARMKTLSGEFRSLEDDLQAAILTEEPEEKPEEKDPETREHESLAERCDVGNIFAAALEHRATQGPEAELQQHYKLAAHQIPLAMLETRAVTPAPGDVGTQQQAIIPGVFPQSVAAFLGIDLPRVGVGEAVFPVLSTSASAETPDEGGEAEETTGSFSADVLSPKRLQASFFYSREDRARFVGMDSALRENLSMALSDALDKQVVAGMNGLLTGTNLANHAASAVTTFAAYRSSLLYARVDGKYALGAGDIRLVVGGGTFAHAASQYRSNNADFNALDSLMKDSGGVRVSAHVPAVSGNKQNAIVRLGTRRDMVAPIWEGVSLIPDEITKAKSGEIVITAVMLYAVKILRADGFYKQQSQHA